MKIIKRLEILILMIFILGCGRQDKVDQKINEKLNVIATTTMLGDLVKEIGGEKVNVTILMNNGVSPHSYQPKLSDTKNIMKGDLLVVNGLYLEGKMEECLKNIDKNKLLVIGDELNKNKLILMESGEYDPHIFLSLELWKDAAEILEKRLIKMDVKNQDYYKKSKDEYIEKLSKLDDYTREQLNKIDKDKRILVTSHRAFNYFAREYSFETNYVKGISSEREIGINTINNLVTYLKDRRIKTIFLENSAPESILNTIVQTSARQNWNVKIGGKLYVGSLGDKESGADTYIKYYKKNIDTIVQGLK
ncbi:metal ABC transporter solute-binding protein, Zn/Mn family [Fusobacterium sp. IOR10]|uniref:metal ABC transporter solute-binding protein, Zn/Mn family n=1 Tax=Fusobacterium sp. IOR10 TaxID=2665157 RepID=UPI0013D1C0D7|nr:zinc ABC transporter substrate-binding protein [Fusobacterium sp. IOR10]